MDPSDVIDGALGGLTDTGLWEKVAADYWSGVHGLLIVVAVAIFVSSLDDLLIDLGWWVYALIERVRSSWPAQTFVKGWSEVVSQMRHLGST